MKDPLHLSRIKLVELLVFLLDAVGQLLILTQNRKHRILQLHLRHEVDGLERRYILRINLTGDLQDILHDLLSLVHDTAQAAAALSAAHEVQPAVRIRHADEEIGMAITLRLAGLMQQRRALRRQAVAKRDIERKKRITHAADKVKHLAAQLREIVRRIIESYIHFLLSSLLHLVSGISPVDTPIYTHEPPKRKNATVNKQPQSTARRVTKTPQSRRTVPRGQKNIFFLHSKGIHGNQFVNMDTTYYVIYGMLLLLSVFGLVVGVSNDACNFLNSSLGCKAGNYVQVAAVAAVGVLLGASFSNGMMEIARSGVMNPSMFTFNEVMLLFLAVMVANVILLDIFNTLGLPTSTTVSLVFSLLGSALGMAVYSMEQAPVHAGLAEYINTDTAIVIVSGIFSSVLIAFLCGTTVMWFARLLFSFHYQRSFFYIGPLWCGGALTAICYFAIFKGLKSSPIVDPDFLAWMEANLSMLVLGAFVVWTLISAFLQHICHINTLRIIVLAGTGALALAFAGNDLVNFIGVFMAADASMDIAQAHLASGGDLASLHMGDLTKPVQTDFIYLLLAGVIMVGALFFSKKARKVTETELKLSSASTVSRERFGSSPPARVMVRQTLNIVRFVQRITPEPIARFVGSRFVPLRPEEETGALYDQIRGSVNLTLAALLISVATSLKLPLSTTYVTFMVAMGSSLADRAWGRDSAVYRITGVLTVVGGWFITALGACFAAFLVALCMSFGGFWGIVIMLTLSGALLIKSTFFVRGEKQEIKLLDVNNEAAVHDFGSAAAGRLGRMVGIYKAMVKALLEEDLDSLKRLRKKTREIKKTIEAIRENEVLPTLRGIPKELADRGQLIFRITEISSATCERLLTLVKASYNHIDNNHAGLNEEQGKDLLALTDKIGRFYPNLTDMLVQGDYADIDKMVSESATLGDDFASCITRHLMHNAEDESSMRNGILYLTLLNETRAMVSHAFSLINRIKELYED